MSESKIDTGNSFQPSVGTKVQTLVAWPGVPKLTEGYIVEDYGSGVMVAWDLPDRPYPKHLSFEQVGKLAAVDPICPLRDGFDKETELSYLCITNQST